MKSDNKNKDTWFQVMLALLAILTIKSLFEHDSSKIISRKGSRLLGDKDKMDEIKRQIKKLEGKGVDSHSEILI